VFAGLDRPERKRRVEVMGQADVDHRDGGVGEKLIERRGNAFAAAGLFDEVRVQITDRDQLRVGRLSEPGDMDLADLAETDQPDTDAPIGHAATPGTSARTWSMARLAAFTGSPPSTWSR